MPLLARDDAIKPPLYTEPAVMAQVSILARHPRLAQSQRRVLFGTAPA